MKKAIFYLLIVLIVALSACSTEPKNKYTQSFSYLENDENGHVSIKDLEIEVTEGEIVSFPSVPSIVIHYDSSGRIIYSEYFVGWGIVDGRTSESTITFDSTFTYSHSDSKFFRAAYCRKLTLNDGEREQEIQLGDPYVFATIWGDNDERIIVDGYEKTSVYPFIKVLRNAQINQKENSSLIGWKLDCNGFCNNSGISFDNIRITERDLQDANYDEKNPGNYINLEFKAYNGGEFVGTTDFFYSGKHLISVINSSDYFALGYYIGSTLRENPHFTVLWEPYPVVSFINGTNTSQSSVAPNTCVQKPADPSENGFKFMWWSLNEAGEAFDFNTPITEDTNLYAVFKQLFSVTFVNEGLTSTVQVAYGEYTGKLNPTKAGHTLQGWSLTQDGPLFDFEETPITSDTTLYAIWEEN